MGSGARGAAQAQGAIIAQAKDYLHKLKSEDFGFTDAFEKQTSKLKDLSAALSQQPIRPSQPVDLPPVAARPGWLMYAAVAAAAIGIFLYVRRRRR